MKMHDKTDSWASAFENAEFEPSTQLWERVELGLAKSANNGFKKRLLFFKLLAAASVSLAAVVGGISLYNVAMDHEEPAIATNNQHEIAESDERQEGVVSESSTAENDGERIETASSVRENRLNTNNSVKDTHAGSVVVKKENKVNKSHQLVSGISEVNERASNQLANERKTDDEGSTAFVQDPASLKSLGISLDGVSELASRDMKMVPRIEHIFESNKSGNKTWVGVSMAMGQNNPSGSGSTESAAANLASEDGFQGQQIRLSEEQNAGVVSAGLTFGHQLKQRWILESGLSFIKRSTLAESNLAINTQGRAEAANSLNAHAQSDGLVLTNSYEIRNTYNSILLPLQAGYILLDRKLDIIIKAGMANEVLLWNRVEDTSGNLGDQVISSGGDSQYNTYLLSGLVSSEFSYSLGERYLVSLAPQLRKSINSVTKSDTGDDTKPLIFTIGFRFNYFLK